MKNRSFTVKQSRVLCGFTQQEMAQKMGINRDTYRRIELNPEKATIAQGKQISDITGISFDAIFFGANST